MPAYPFNPGIFHFSFPRPHPSGSFRPQGPLIEVGNPAHLRIGFKGNPVSFTSNSTRSARIVVGFNVGSKPTYHLDDLIDITTRIRKKQGKSQDSSFVAQKGIYTHDDGTTVRENGGQVLIIDLSGGTMEEFQSDIVELGEIIATEMQQESVIVEIQINGVTQFTMGVRP